MSRTLRKDGARTYEILRAAWRSGLDTGHPYQVPRPLAYHADRRLLLTTANDGVALGSFAAGDNDELVRACRRAARWLLKFHAIPLESIPERGFYEDQRYQTSSADAESNDGRRMSDQNEAYAGPLRDLWVEHKRRSEAEHHLARTIVPIHGKFGPESVLLSDGITAVINFERSRLGEPGSDLARFAFYLWRRIFEDTDQWQRAETATKAFLAEYEASKPEQLARLPYYWGARILKSLEKKVSHTRYLGSNELIDRIVQFHVAQFKFAHKIGTGAARPQRPPM